MGDARVQDGAVVDHVAQHRAFSARFLAGGAVEDHTELIAAQAADNVALAHMLHQQAPDMFQNSVAGGMAGVVLWGLHRDTAELRRIAFPVFSHGTNPAGPMRLDAREPEAFTAARFGALRVTADDFVFADDDGAVFVARGRLEEVVRVAQGIGETERAQAQLVRGGRLLREQLRLAEFVEARRTDPTLTFRRHLRGMRGAIEE